MSFHRHMPSNFSLISLSPLGSKVCLHQILFLDALQNIPVLKWGLGSVFKSTYLRLHPIAIHLYLQKGFLMKTSTPLFLRVVFLVEGAYTLQAKAAGSARNWCIFQPMSAKD